MTAVLEAPQRTDSLVNRVEAPVEGENTYRYLLLTIHWPALGPSDVLSEFRTARRLSGVAIARIKDIIRAQEPQEIQELEEALYNDLGSRYEILSDVALDEEALINIRAIAARLFVSKVGSRSMVTGLSERETGLTRLAEHDNPLIRLGVVLGFADARNWEKVRDFAADTHPSVREEARELLNDAV